MKSHVCIALLLAPAAFAQVLDSQPAPGAPAQSPQSAPASTGSSDQSKFLGKETPFFDPDSETVSWDGKMWNVTNNRIFRARFEKYLNAPEETSAEDASYDALIKQILDLLSPRKVNAKALDEAFGLLPKAAEYKRDAGLCDTIANQVYSAWQSQQDRDRLLAATNSLEGERERLERNKLITIQKLNFGSTVSATRGRQNGRGAHGASNESMQERLQQAELDATTQPYDLRLAEVNALLQANRAKRAGKEIQAKLEFQTLMVQLFLQRRFEHVLIATRFYRNVFNDGDDEVKIKGSARDMFDKTTGMPPTVSTLDAMANEAIRDVAEGVDAYNYLLENEELDSATKRLSESFLIGEFMPPIRTLSREKKRRSLAYAQKANKLVNAIEVKDYEQAEKLVRQMEEEAKDFDSSKPMAAIQTSKTTAAFHLAKARNAAVAGNKEELEQELKAAAEIWPRNPQLADVAGMIFSQGNVQNKALVDFDQLLGQKNYRQIFDDRERFSAAVAFDPARQEQLRKVLADMTEIEKAIVRAQEIEKRGDFAGAWESAELAFASYPSDSKLNQIRADLTTKAADFVRALRRAEELEQRGQPGSSLAWFLKAQKEYPASDLAKQGIERLTKQILPDDSDTLPKAVQTST